ncbi:MAG TPA: hypothetical protein VF159_03795 [Gemmatimonadaceae bacterium]
MRRFLSVMVLAGTLGSAFACGGGGPAAPVTTLDGTWNGKVGSDQVSLGLTQADTVVTGTGVLAGNTGLVQVDVTGSFHAPNFNLTFTAQGFNEVIAYTGQLSTTAPQMVGQLNGSGFTQASLTLTKK